jgi:MbtH protein
MDVKVDEDRVYRVVINVEEQYSIWPATRDIPVGWKAVGPSGSKDECLGYIDKIWTDMRPLSLRKAMDGGSKRANGEA